jgi:Ca2+-binding RTX toxin-like protein
MTNTVHTIVQGGGTYVINDFVPVGRGVFVTDAWKAMIDTLRFEGGDLVARNMLIQQVGNDTVITFQDITNTKVILTNVDYQMLDNVPTNANFNPDIPYGNFVFDGQKTLTDNVDVWNREMNLTQVQNENTVTFLNGRSNNVTGFENSDDVINAGGGDDVVRGLSGSDSIRGQTGNDKLYGDAGADLILGGDGDDLLDGGSGSDALVGEAGNDRLFGGSGDDQMWGGAGIDFFSPGSGTDYVDGGSESDTVSYLNSNAGVTLNYGAFAGFTGIGGFADGDFIINVNNFTGSNFDDVMVASGNNGGTRNTLRGEGGSDVLYAGAGNDTVYGGSGIDIINGGLGNDVMEGGSETDYFVFNYGTDFAVNSFAGWSQDVITDFNPGQDVITIYGVFLGQYQEWFDTHVLEDNNGNVLIVDDNYNVAGQYSSTISLLGVDISDLNHTNLILIGPLV